MKTKALNIKEIIFSVALFWLVLLAIAFFTSQAARSAQEISDIQISEGEFKMAKVIFPIENVSQNGNNISLTITKNARALKSKSKNVDYSAMQIVGTSAINCPLVNSTAIDKNVKGYNPLTGRADLSVTFKTEEQAQMAAAANCLLIKDTETE